MAAPFYPQSHLAAERQLVRARSGENIRTYEDYYVYDGKTMQRVKKDKAFILAALSDKRDSIEAFIETNKLKLKSIDDIKRAIDYYNTL